MERETYQNLPDSNKLDILFDLHMESKEKIEALDEKVDGLRLRAARWGGIAGVISFMVGCIITWLTGWVSPIPHK